MSTLAALREPSASSATTRSLTAYGPERRPVDSAVVLEVVQDLELVDPRLPAGMTREGGRIPDLIGKVPESWWWAPHAPASCLSRVGCISAVRTQSSASRRPITEPERMEDEPNQSSLQA